LDNRASWVLADRIAVAEAGLSHATGDAAMAASYLTGAGC